jgi:RNA polymerase sigma factor (sigma-70 family)
MPGSTGAGKCQAARLGCEATSPSQAGPPEATLICAEQARQVYEAMAQLPLEQREAIALRIKAGMNLEQIAAVQNASYVAVRARYRRGIEALRGILSGRL